MYLVRPSWLIQKWYPNTVWRKDSFSRKLYLTFDDGPMADVTPFVLDVLKSKNVRATFFCVGENVKKHPEIFQRILEEKHAIGNHTFSHLNGWNSTCEEYMENVQACNAALTHFSSDSSAASESSVLFRPPYGKMKRSQLKSLREKYSIVMWDVLSGDFDEATSPEKCLENVMNNYRNGSVIVFHDSLKARRSMEYAMPRFVDHALSEGFTFEVISGS
jgi:peptidoglycan-N-acetylglucosamine deacetylase